MPSASLLLGKFGAPGATETFSARENRDRFAAIANCAPPTEYRQAYDRWVKHLKALPGTTLAAEFEVQGRMIVGIGSASVLENSMTLHRLWGVPLIPGSGLKGVASHYARWQSDQPGGVPLGEDALKDFFGDTTISGAVVFHDAWYVPGSAKADRPFMLDVVTPHHSSYYNEPTKPPWDFEDPIPNAFVSARGTYLVAVTAADHSWSAYALDMLGIALREWGVGAKTNAGYGSLRRGKDVLAGTSAAPPSLPSPTPDAPVHDAPAAPPVAPVPITTPETPPPPMTSPAAAKLRSELANLNQKVEVGLANRWARLWGELSDEREKTELGAAVLQRVHGRPSVYRKVTGRDAPDQTATPAGTANKDFQPLLEWLDEHPA